jgi:hypothetical protein
MRTKLVEERGQLGSHHQRLPKRERRVADRVEFLNLELQGHTSCSFAGPLFVVAKAQKTWSPAVLVTRTPSIKMALSNSPPANPSIEPLAKIAGSSSTSLNATCVVIMNDAQDAAVFELMQTPLDSTNWADRLVHVVAGACDESTRVKPVLKSHCVCTGVALKRVNGNSPLAAAQSRAASSQELKPSTTTREANKRHTDSSSMMPWRRVKRTLRL